MYVREEAMDDVGAIIEGLEGCVAHAQRIGDEAEYDDEPRAFLDAVCAAVDCLGSLKVWLALAEPAGAKWEAFLSEHPELED